MSVGKEIYITKSPRTHLTWGPYELSDSNMADIHRIEADIGRNTTVFYGIAARSDEQKSLLFIILHGVPRALIVREWNHEESEVGGMTHIYYRHCIFDAVTGEDLHLVIEDWSCGIFEDGSTSFCESCDGILTPSEEGYLLPKHNLYFSLTTGRFHPL
jgi:hypothetical protein